MSTPHVKEWIKTTTFGNYLDPKQNHKDKSKNTEQYNLVRMARKFLRHPGSKSLKVLRTHY